MNNKFHRMVCRCIRLFGIALFCLNTHAGALEWKSPPDKITLLVVNAHPDDEGIFFGGALPYYSGVLQVPTMLLSMTSGDWHPLNLLIRENEMRNAAWIYGLRYEPLFPRFRDVPSHGMVTNPYPNRIDATWDYWADGILQGDGSDVAQGKAKAINYVAEVIRRYQPEVIITHDFNGEYGHDNHKATALTVTEAYYVAADSEATATNLAGLPPWQARKLYVHLYQTNQLFHTGWETPRDELGGKSARQVANDGLDAHVSQNSPDVSTYYLSGENYNGHDSERWGLFASTVGLDTVVTNGTAVGDFFENLDLSSPINRSPEFFPKLIPAALGFTNQDYAGQTLARYATDPDKVAGDLLSFSKVEGPSWLIVAPNGALSGRPGVNNEGENLFTVRVTDTSGAYDDALLKIIVGGRIAAAWNFNEYSGTIANDFSGEGHHATLSEGASWIAGRDRGALSLIGTNGFAVSENVPVGNAFTVAAWICSSNLVGEHSIIGEANSYTLKTSGTALRFTIPGTRDHTYAANLTVGQWYHVAATFEAGVANGCKFYINGQFRTATNASTKNLTSNETWIGRNQWGQYFSGLIDDVRIYRGVLSQSEIAALYGNRSPAFSVNPILASNGMEQTLYSAGTLAAHVSDPEDNGSLSFQKASGPDWLIVGADGTLTGTPNRMDVGTNTFRVRVIDPHRAAAEATLRIVVAYQPSLKIEIALQGQGKPQLLFVGEAHRNYQVLGSSNLINWFPLETISTDAIGKADWSDTATRTNTFFYRIQD